MGEGNEGYKLTKGELSRSSRKQTNKLSIELQRLYQLC